MVARGRLRSTSIRTCWRSKKPIIYRNTPQWFVYMDRPYAADKIDAHAGAAATYRERVKRSSRATPSRASPLTAIENTQVLPAGRPEPPPFDDR